MEDYYDVLGLRHRRADALLTANDIKQAYRRALLRHHPDKSVEHAQVSKGWSPSGAAYTVDQITAAFKTLSDPAARADYDRKLSLHNHEAAASGRSSEETKYFSGLDIVDLDDLEYDETTATWWRGCRCGQQRGFIVTEDELAEDAQHGELVTGCRGCSLWLKILFQADDGAQADDRARETS
ncbi:hypothetical protein MBLNU457_3706t1 [Dothideomycetes sp. NU457]